MKGLIMSDKACTIIQITDPYCTPEALILLSNYGLTVEPGQTHNVNSYSAPLIFFFTSKPSSAPFLITPNPGEEESSDYKTSII